eukprot:364298-Chlamydomonas_euryale.AAC.4
MNVGMGQTGVHDDRLAILSASPRRRSRRSRRGSGLSCARPRPTGCQCGLRLDRRLGSAMEGSKHGGEAHMLHTLEEDVQHVEEHVLPLPPRNEPSRKGGDLYSGGLALNPTHDGGRRNSDYLNEDEDDFFHPSDEDADSAGSTGSMSSWSDEDEEDRGAFVEFIVRRIEAPKDTWNALPEAVALHEELPPPVKLRRSVYGLPLVPPYHPVCLAWLGGMLLFDIVYTVSLSYVQRAGKNWGDEG